MSIIFFFLACVEFTSSFKYRFQVDWRRQSYRTHKLTWSNTQCKVKDKKKHIFFILLNIPFDGKLTHDNCFRQNCFQINFHCAIGNTRCNKYSILCWIFLLSNFSSSKCKRGKKQHSLNCQWYQWIFEQKQTNNTRKKGRRTKKKTKKLKCMRGIVVKKRVLTINHTSKLIAAQSTPRENQMNRARCSLFESGPVHTFTM